MQSIKNWINQLFDPAPKRILFRVDAGRVIGLSFGHLYRCLILSRIIKKIYSCETIFLMKNYLEGVNLAVNNNENVIKIKKNEKDDLFLSVDKFKADYIVFDLPYDDLDLSYFTLLKKKGLKIIFIDDCRFISPDVDIILNSNIIASKKTILKNHIKYFLGIDYFIFDESLLTLTPIRKKDFLNIVITFGGSDPTDLTYKVLRVLLEKTKKDKKWEKIYFYVIIGSGYIEYVEKIDILIKHGYHNFQLIKNPPEIIPYFLGSDLVICAGGRTMYELLYLKKRFFPIASIEHECEVIKTFLRYKIVKHALLKWNKHSFIKTLEMIIEHEK
ncbi:glycosyltransferase [Candidatus Magnetomorum sp. HK-1]|nr:glycosyltransferase [Candidatus Magnetomorum sp. HK-1]